MMVYEERVRTKSANLKSKRAQTTQLPKTVRSPVNPFYLVAFTSASSASESPPPTRPPSPPSLPPPPPLHAVHNHASLLPYLPPPPSQHQLRPSLKKKKKTIS